MNKLFLLVFFALITSSFSVKKASQEYTPPGTVHLNENIFIDQYFVSNIDYKEFEFFLEDYLHKKEVDSLPKKLLGQNFEYITPDFIEEMKVDSNFKKPLRYGEPMKTHYYANHPAFADYPKVNIEVRQAEAYCHWRSQLVNINIINSRSFTKKHPEITSIQFRLTSQKELEIAREKFDYFERDTTAVNYMYSLNSFSKKQVKNKAVFLEYSLSDLCVEGSLFGENWDREKKETDEYSVSSFRCVCEVVKEN